MELGYLFCLNLSLYRKLQKQDKGVVMTMVYKEAGHGYCSRSVEDKAVLTVDSSTGRVLLHNKMKVGTKRINIPLVLFVCTIRTLENRFLAK